MKKILILSGILFSVMSHGQVVVDDFFGWAATGAATATTSATSSNFDFCNDEQVNYTVSTPNSGNFIYSSTYAGLIIPAATSTSTSQVTFRIDFSQSVENVSIRIIDLDGAGNLETITDVSPAYSSLTSLVGTFSDNSGGLMTGVNASANNSDGWINWSGPVGTFIEFNYNRPGSGYGLVIDAIHFECTDQVVSSCECKDDVSGIDFQDPSSDGIQNSVINVNTNGAAVMSVCIDLPTYVSHVDEACLLCDKANQEQFGTIISSNTIAGVAGVLHDPLGLGYSRKICYEFPSPTVVNEDVELILQFPPVVELSCCENNVDFCFDVAIKHEDCTSCEYTVCSNGDNDDVDDSVSDDDDQDFKTQNSNVNHYNDAAESKNVNVWPNPTSEFLNLDLDNDLFIGGNVTIVSANGTLIKSAKVTGLNNKIDLTDLASGIYSVTVSKNGKKESMSVVVQ